MWWDRRPACQIVGAAIHASAEAFGVGGWRPLVFLRLVVISVVIDRYGVI